MAWSYDVSKRRYADGDREVTERQMLDLRNAIAGTMADESATLAQRLIDGVISLVEWAKAFAALIRAGVAAGFLLGRGGRSQIDARALALMDALIGDQLDYAKGFATELAPTLAAGTATTEGVAARSALYAGASVQAFHVGQSESYGFSFEAYPADGTSECGGNCRCELIITDADENNWSVTWDTVGDGNVCRTCAERGRKWQSFLVPKVAA